MGKLININQQNLHETLNLNHFLNHDHAYDHGAAVTVAGLDLFQTDGLGEDVHAGATGSYGGQGAGGFLGDLGFEVGQIVGDLFNTDHI